MTALGSTLAVGGDRREARREARRRALLGAAMGIVARDGVHNLTMQAVADRVGCSVGTVYNFFSSKGALVADLQDASVQHIQRSLVMLRDRHHALVAETSAGPREAAASELLLFGDFLVACWDIFPEESHMLFSVLADGGEIVSGEELDRVIGSTLALLAVGAEIIEGAVAAEVIAPGETLDRVVIGASAILGVLLTSHLAHVAANVFDHRHMGRDAWRSLLRGWGMSAHDQAEAEARMESLVASGPMAPDPDEVPDGVTEAGAAMAPGES